ncbi:MAG: hypothetical protein Q8R28_18870 [Dehalococcoidia bacterium]|nr:hypothetical protein [Dehalococcoidia bacterium]
MAKGELEDALLRLGHRWRAARPPSAPLSLTPGCAYGVRYAQLVEDLQKDLAEVKARLNGLIFLLAGAVALEVVMKVLR